MKSLARQSEQPLGLTREPPPPTHILDQLDENCPRQLLVPPKFFLKHLRGASAGVLMKGGAHMNRKVLAHLLLDLAVESGQSAEEAGEIVKQAVDLDGVDISSLSGPELREHEKKCLKNLAMAVGHSEAEAEQLVGRRFSGLK
ncbi:hypothetical protein IH779_03235 [Patescibacteria group bacterium]|nr:hypothetical protein [Patescibacteria group bacterium]